MSDYVIKINSEVVTQTTNQRAALLAFSAAFEDLMKVQGTQKTLRLEDHLEGEFILVTYEQGKL